MKSLISILALFVVAMLTGCAGSPLAVQKGNPDVYSRGQAMSTGYVVEGKVIQARKVKLGADTSITSIGGAFGGIIAAAATNKRSGAVQAIASIAGAVAGGVAGNMLGTSDANEIVVQLADNSVRVVVQEPGAVAAVAGERVLLLINGGEARVVGRL